MQRFKIGDAVRLWKPGHAEHGASGTVYRIDEYDGPKHRGPWAYRVEWLWRDGNGPRFIASLPDCMVVSEQDFQESKN